MFLVEPSQYSIPILHIEMGMVNKSWNKFLNFLDDNIERLPREEIEARRKLRGITEKAEQLKIEIERLRPINCILAPTIRAAKKKEKVKLLSEVHKEMKKLRKVCSDMCAKRNKDKNGMGALVEAILKEVANATPEAYHGGDLNGVCCRRLLNNIDEIMRSVHVLCKRRRLEAIDAMQEAGEEDTTCSEEELTEKIRTYTNLFLVMDNVFVLTRIIAPTEDEIDEAERAIKALEIMWKMLRLSVTVKAHILFEHTIFFMRTVEGGIADKGEDFIEKAHQDGCKLEHMTMRMGGPWEEKQRTQLSRQWVSSEPGVQSQIDKINNASIRTFKDRSPGITERRAIARTERRRRTKLYIIPRILCEQLEN